MAQAIYVDGLWSKLRSELSGARMPSDMILKPGDRVAISLNQEEIKSRNYTQRFTEETFIIKRVIDYRYRPMYILQTAAQPHETIDG